MRNLGKRFSDTPVYLYVAGALFWICTHFVKLLKLAVKYINEIIFLAAFACMIVAAQMFEDNLISFNVTILLLAVLFILVAATTKVKILDAEIL